jgi:hypothetical protein
LVKKFQKYQLGIQNQQVFISSNRKVGVMKDGPLPKGDSEFFKL